MVNEDMVPFRPLGNESRERNRDATMPLTAPLSSSVDAGKEGRIASGTSAARTTAEMEARAPKASPGDMSGNLSMGRLTDDERAAGNARMATAQAAKQEAPKQIKYTSFKGPGNYGIMGTPGDFSKLSDGQIENRMRQVKKGGLFQTVRDEDQSDEYKSYAAELARRRAPKQEAPKQEAPKIPGAKDYGSHHSPFDTPGFQFAPGLPKDGIGMGPIDNPIQFKNK